MAVSKEKLVKTTRLFVCFWPLIIICSCNKPAQPSATNSLSTAAPAPTSTQQSPAVSSPVQSAVPSFDCCSLLTVEEIEAVQGSSIRDKKNSERSANGLRMTQCFYTAAEYSQSVSLALTQIDPTDSTQRSVKAYWSETFGRESKSPPGPESEKQSKEEGKESGEMKKIEGLGDDARWSSTRVGGALYVLKNDTILRISLGGKDNEQTRIEKSKALAQKALARLRGDQSP
jgi:hypothetical protein